MASRRVANVRLRALVAEAGWTGQEFASAVNTVAAEAGLKMRYDRTSAAHWFAGIRPAPKIAASVAEALSRRLGRRITSSATGLTPEPDDAAGAVRGMSWQDPVQVLSELAAGPGRYAALRHTPYRLAAATVPGFADVADVAPGPEEAASATSDSVGARVTADDVRTLRMMFNVFDDADVTFGGGRSRAALSAYLATDVCALLAAAGGGPSVRGELRIAAGRLCHLAGFMCFDDGLHGVSQRYYLAALQLARQARDPALYATVLRGMSVQALALGHGREALVLAESAVAAGSRVPRMETAFLTGQLALAVAATGDYRSALLHLEVAEQRLGHSEIVGAADITGSYHHAALDHQRAEVLVAAGDPVGAIDALERSLRHRPVIERRGRALTTARLGEVNLDCGRLEAACTAWLGLCADYPHLTSGRADTALRTMRARLRPYQRVPIARGVLDHAANLTAVRPSPR